jgi:DNA-binding transcriptional LysR family regulator
MRVYSQRRNGLAAVDMGRHAMELRQLRYFLTVLRLGSINRAAAVLNVTQPSLSHSIKALERSVGAELILRGGGGIRATPVGEEFAKFANNIVREAEKAKAMVEASRGAGEGRISLGILSAFCNHITPQILSEFFASSHNPDVDLFVHTSNFDEIARRILRAEWDLVLTLATQTDGFPPEIGFKALGTVTSSVYCGADHPLAGQARVSAAEMAPYKWVASNLGLTDRLLAERLIPEGGDAPRVCLRTDSMTMIPSLLSEFPFLCMAPDVSVAREVANGTLVRVDQTAMTASSQLVLLYSNLSNRTPAMRTLMAIISEHVRQLGVVSTQIAA